MATKKQKPQNETPEELLAGLLEEEETDDFDIDSLLMGAVSEVSEIDEESGLGKGEEEYIRVIPRYINHPQRTSTVYSTFRNPDDDEPTVMTGYVYLGTSDPAEKKEPKNYHNKRNPVRFLMVDSLSTRRNRSTLHPRSMPSYDPVTGKQKYQDPWACSSPNGGAPSSFYFGKQIFDHTANVTVTIGAIPKADMTGYIPSAPDGYICQKCPFSQWVEDASGKKNPPLCNTNPMYVVYVTNEGKEGLATFRGGNGSITKGLRGGAAVGEPGGPDPASGVEKFYGIEYWFAQDGTYEYRIPIQGDPEEFFNNLPKNARDGYGMANTKVGIIGLYNDEETEYTRAYAASSGKAQKRFFDLLNSGDYTGIIVSVPAYRNAPQGKPEAVLQLGQPFPPVYAVSLVSVKNNYNEPGYGPHFMLEKEPLGRKEYLGFLQAFKEYYGREESDDGKNYREKILRMETIEEAEAWAATANEGGLKIQTPQASPQLPQGNLTVDKEEADEDEDILDAEFDDILDDDEIPF